VPEPLVLRVLIVDDDPDMVRLLRHVLQAHGYPAPVVVRRGAAAAAAAAAAEVVLLDHQLPDGNGMELIEPLRSLPSRPSVVLITGHGNESLAAAALRLGADDYLAKDGSLTELLPQVLDRVRRARALRDALEAAERELLRTERLAAIGEMSVTLHHEINNPLMAATAEAELLLAGPEPLTASQREALRAVHQSLGRIRDILHRSGRLNEARTTEYLPGTRMIDLSARDVEPPTVSLGIAALAIPDEDSARVAALLLRQAGYQVQRCRNVEELNRWARTLGTSLVVVTSGGAAGPIGGLVPTSDRDYRLVALVGHDAAAAREAGADRVVSMPFDPATFIAEVVG
jgi:DNA-binding response OmpR family regulator